MAKIQGFTPVVTADPEQPQTASELPLRDDWHIKVVDESAVVRDDWHLKGG